MDVENFKKVFLPLHPKLFRIAYALVENRTACSSACRAPANPLPQSESL